jgi:hypothetical protein
VFTRLISAYVTVWLHSVHDKAFLSDHLYQNALDSQYFENLLCPCNQGQMWQEMEHNVCTDILSILMIKISHP